MADKRLLSVIPGPVFGGAHNQAMRLRVPLEDLGWKTTVVLPDEAGDGVHRLHAAGVDVIQMRMKRLRQTRTARPLAEFALDFGPQVRRLGRLMRRARIDVVQVHGVVNLQPAVAARMAGAGLVVQLLDTRCPPFMRQVAMPIVCRAADVIMSTGRAVAEVYPGAAGLGDRLIPYVPPVDVDMFSTDATRRARARDLLDVPHDALLIGAVGNRNPQKGFEHILNAAAQVRTTMDNIEVRIVGSESPAHAGYAAHLERLAQAKALGRALMAVPDNSTVADIMPAFDVLVVTSVPLSEGIPTVLLEAMATGVPIVSTDVGAVREIIVEGVNGYVIPTGNIDACVVAIREVLTKPTRAANMGKVGQAMVRANWSLQHSAAAHAKAYELAITRRAARRSGHTPQ